MALAASSVLGSSTGCILAISEQGFLQSAIGQPFEVFGYKEEELVSRSVNLLLPGFYHESDPAFWQKFAPSPNSTSSNSNGDADDKRMLKVVEGCHKNGEIFPASIYLSVVKTTDSKFYLGVVEKLPERCSVMVTFAGSNEDGGNIVHCNRSVEDVFGYLESEIYGRSFRVLLDEANPNTSEIVDEFFKQAINALNGVHTVTQSHHLDRVFTTRAKHKDGSLFPVCLKFRMVNNNNSNSNNVALAEFLIFRMVRSDSAAGNDFDVALKANQSGIIVYCNPLFVKPLLGYTEQELLGQHLNKIAPGLFPTDDSKDILDTIPTELLQGLPDGIVNYINNPKRRRIAFSTDEWKKEGFNRKLDIVHKEGTTFLGEIVVTSSSNASSGSISLRIRKVVEGEQVPHIKEPLPVKTSTRGSKGKHARALAASAPATPTATVAHVMKVPEPPMLKGRSAAIPQAPYAPPPQYPYATVQNPTDPLYTNDFASNAQQYPPYGSIRQGTPMIPTPQYVGQHSPQQYPPNYDAAGVRYPSPGQLRTGGASHMMLVGSYVLGERLGKGRFGHVRLATHVLTGEKVAIKMMDKESMDPDTIDRAIREIEILKQLDHPNIAKLYEVIHTKERINIVMEYVSGGDLYSYVKERGGLSEEHARSYFVQIVSAVHYCHRMNILHRDIKQQNILLDSARTTVKLIDFGLSNFFEESGEKQLGTFCGTPAYAAPEMILRKKYTGPEVDVWSMGVVLYSMITGTFPFNSVSDIIVGRFSFPPKISPSCADLIAFTLTVDVARRAKLSDIENHPWVLNQASANNDGPPTLSLESTSGMPFISSSDSSTDVNNIPPNDPPPAAPPMKELELRHPQSPGYPFFQSASLTFPSALLSSMQLPFYTSPHSSTTSLRGDQVFLRGMSDIFKSGSFSSHLSGTYLSGSRDDLSIPSHTTSYSSLNPSFPPPSPTTASSSSRSNSFSIPAFNPRGSFS
eukprot:TRINITY_DN254_c0_g1_i2.p1 TRINITY_DN254_c0_g1~~TRINITY_DN254_c0_g1_i2.p1  ORF type:complete len:970 (-),score=183.85 TRINITY_DN254_c0_g1_i2:58-2967(-)